MSHLRFDNLSKILNGYNDKKNWWGIHFYELMYRQCNCSNKYKVNNKCVHEGKFRVKYIIYKVKCTLCDTIYIDNKQHTFKKIKDSNFSDVQCTLKNGQKKTHLLNNKR